MLEEMLFPDVKEIPEDIFLKYPKRNKGIVVTRIAPSPTGFLHIGAVYSAMFDKILAYKNNGVFFLRIEDTDKKREVYGASEKFLKIFKNFGFDFDEGAIGENNSDIGEYGPYIQSKREDIYKVFLKDLVKKGLAYPCFLTSDEIEKIRQEQENLKAPTGIYKEYSKWRYASFEEIKKEIDNKKEFVIRLKSPGELLKKIEVNDLVKGKIMMQENFLDIVLMKRDGIPTYHFAHLIDDYLMGTTHVIRGDEWFASLPLHIQLFNIMGWKVPSYLHYAPLVKIEGNSKRKLSKRKDLEADAQFYFKNGYLIDAILDFLSNMINSSFENWRKNNFGKIYLDFDFKLEKSSNSGALVDLDKLNYTNAYFIKNMDLELLYEKLEEFLRDYEIKFYEEIFSKFSKDYNLSILKELQKRLITFKDYKELTNFFYEEPNNFENIESLLVNQKMKIENIHEAKKGLLIALNILNTKKDDFVSVDEIKNIFVEKIKEVQMKNGQVLWPVRIALSLEEFSPGAFELIYILGVKKSIQRIKKILDLI